MLRDQEERKRNEINLTEKGEENNQELGEVREMKKKDETGVHSVKSYASRVLNKKK